MGGDAAPASAFTGTASISGNVKGQGSPNVNLEGVTVSLETPVGEQVGSTTTDKDGNYLLSDVAAGSFTLAFYDSSSMRTYAQQWWDAKPTAKSAVFFNVTAGQVVSGKNAVLEQAASISGNVKGEGAPNVNLASVYVFADAADGAWMGADTTDADGNYSIAGLAANSYTLTFLTYATGLNYAGELWNDKPTRATADYISVTAGQARIVKDTVLAVGGMVSGNVKGQASPNVNLADVWVDAYNSDEELVGYATTDVNGNYSIAGIGAASITLVFDKPGYAPEWWNSQTTRAAAQFFTVPPQGGVMGRDAVLAIGAASEYNLTASNVSTIVAGNAVTVNYDAHISDFCTFGWVQVLVYPAGVDSEISPGLNLPGLGWQRIDSSGPQSINLTLPDAGSYFIEFRSARERNGCVDGPDLTGTGHAGADFVVTPGVERLAGADRFDASAGISAANFDPGVSVAYVANGSKFPDALSGAPVAGKDNAPVLLVTADGVPSSIATELDRLKPGKIVILGGEASVNASVQRSLQQYAPVNVPVERLAGADRFDASAAISRASFDPGVSVAYVANGLKFPDALSGAPVAGKNGAPVLLVTSDGIPATIAAELARLKPKKIVVLGGTASVSSEVQASLQEFAPVSVPVERLAGADRFDASAAISAKNFAAVVPVVYVANGLKFPDALSGAPVAGKNKAPVLLVTAGSVPASIAEELARLQPAKIVVLGGTASVSDAVAAELAAYIR
ncbi:MULTISPECIES: cell wall-binding repeat-containing protein [unclassified Cryobacterium]|uniref:cell wall-binding repeat-containing protein n=1 Tax=unclassified Cryobacterium TaxID=2649013 RepID=UPI00141B771A|nr:MULTISPECIES: cell wall-binding repeat-containing protein [unclassified Cryobacterium]